jgi:hypothetical protein
MTIANTLADGTNRLPPAARRRPTAIAATPNTAPGEASYPADATRWNTPARQRIGFHIDDPHHDQYRFDVDGRCFVVVASGDLDGDGTRSSFSRRVCPQANGTFAVEALQVTNERRMTSASFALSCVVFGRSAREHVGLRRRAQHRASCTHRVTHTQVGCRAPHDRAQCAVSGRGIARDARTQPLPKHPMFVTTQQRQFTGDITLRSRVSTRHDDIENVAAQRGHDRTSLHRRTQPIAARHEATLLRSKYAVEATRRHGAQRTHLCERRFVAGTEPLDDRRPTACAQTCNHPRRCNEPRTHDERNQAHAVWRHSHRAYTSR